MKTKDIISICKKRKNLILTEPDETGVQFAGDGYGAFLLEGIKNVDADTMLAIMDVGKDERENWKIIENVNLGKTYDFENDVEYPTYRTKVDTLEIAGYATVPVTVRKNGAEFIYLIRKEHLKAIKGESILIAKYTKDGDIYFCVRNGMFIDAFFVPLTDASGDLRDIVRNLTAGLNAAAGERK